MKRRTRPDETRRWWLAIPTAAMLLVLAVTASSKPFASTELAAYQGVWTRSAREHDDAELAVVIERVAEGMSFWMRGLARRMLRASISPPEHFTIRVIEHGLLIQDDDEEPRAFRIDDEPQEDTAEPNRMWASDGALHEDWRHGESSYGTTRWALSESQELIVTVTAFDERLPGRDREPGRIRYATTYSRTPDAANSLPPE